MKKLPSELHHLLSIHSPSGREFGVVKYVLPRLKKTMDSVTIDTYGNILAETKLGDDPYTILLSAHMDTVARHRPKPKWRKGNEIYTQSNSALGGDDKCGIAVILAVLRNMRRTKFSGTVKVIFSREEEIGCVGASRAVDLNPKWFEGITSSIVIDRRGADNVVIGSGFENFCSPEYGTFWEEMSYEVGFTGKQVEGTISDTMVFSELGINGVNLSAGYYNAHTKQEYIKVDETIQTAKWVLAGLDCIQEWVYTYGDFPAFEYQLPQYSKYGSYTSAYLDEWNAKYKIDDVYFDTCDFCWQEVPEDTLTVTPDRFQLCPKCLPHAPSSAGLAKV